MQNAKCKVQNIGSATRLYNWVGHSEERSDEESLLS